MCKFHLNVLFIVYTLFNRYNNFIKERRNVAFIPSFKVSSPCSLQSIRTGCVFFLMGELNVNMFEISVKSANTVIYMQMCSIKITFDGCC